MAGYGYQPATTCRPGSASARGWWARPPRSAADPDRRMSPPTTCTIGSGLGEASPVNLVVLPVLFEDQVLGVIELASFEQFSDVHLAFLDQLMETDRRLDQHDHRQLPHRGAAGRVAAADQRAAGAVGRAAAQQEELADRTPSWKRRRRCWPSRTARSRSRTSRSSRPGAALEERAEQLALSSQYKSEFLANMSHELRTPLNSLLILAKLLAENPDGTSPPSRSSSRETIHSAGQRPARAHQRHPRPVQGRGRARWTCTRSRCRRSPSSSTTSRPTFRPLAAEKGLTFDVSTSTRTCPSSSTPTSSGCSRCCATCCPTR